MIDILFGVGVVLAFALCAYGFLSNLIVLVIHGSRMPRAAARAFMLRVTIFGCAAIVLAWASSAILIALGMPL